MLGTDVIWVAGSNVAECSPITTNYIWQAREQGAKVIVSRSAHHADRAHLRPVPAGEAGPRRRALRRRPAPHDRARLARSRVHRRSTRSASTQVAAVRAASGRRARTAEVTGVPRARRSAQAAEWWGTAKTSFLFHARGIEHHSNGVQNVLGAINLVLASGRIGKPKCGYGTITGQGNGQGGREHGQKCDQLPGWRDISNPEHRALHRRRLGHRRAGAARARASTPTRCSARSTAARSRGCCRSASTRWSRCRTTTFVTRMPREAGVLRRDRLLPERDRAARRRRAARQPAGGGRRHGDAGRGPRHQDQQGRRLPGRGARRTGGSSRTSRRRSAGRTGFTFDEPARDLRGAARRQQGRRRRLLGHHLREDRAADGVFWPCYSEDPADRRADRPSRARRGCSSRGSYNPVAKGAGPFYFPDGKARFNVADYRAAGRRRRRRSIRSILTTGRVVSQFLSGTQTRRIGPLVEQYPEPRIEMHPRLAAQARHRRRRLGDGRDPARQRSRCGRRS